MSANTRGDGAGKGLLRSTFVAAPTDNPDLLLENFRDLDMDSGLRSPTSARPRIQHHPVSV